MSDDDLLKLRARSGIAPWRLRLAEFIESGPVQRFILAAIIVNAVVLGLYIDPTILPQLDPLWRAIDLFCLGVFAVEIVIKLVAYRLGFFKSGWNVFDFLVVAIALIPGNGALSVLRTLRVLRVLRLLTVVPSLRRVVAAFIHSIPGLGAVVMVMAIFFYAAAVMAVGFFGATFPDWFGSIGKSLYTLFQVMTLESWSMGIVRPVMEAHPFAWAFFVPFIIIATFTILNLFIGIIVSTMQELAMIPDPESPNRETIEILSRIEEDLARLRSQIGK
ncbi:MAG: ion transporter [Verrucomicrobiales bacterium]|jgi:voltage-gated sodium channel|nr:ion transporter [Verrucomicrobiales bacterium]MDP4790850.1 ion transporter [Verrucomicrobiales bacterium]MDP4939691.1 ion transporter [Verrucomicrobiales bacterium]MDP5006195.1 ion transporter [Verrucomicrobiales bacterium]